MKKKNKKEKSTIQILREIRDRISLETMDMDFEEMQEYFRKRKEKFRQKENMIAAEPKTPYGKK